MQTQPQPAFCQNIVGLPRNRISDEALLDDLARVATLTGKKTLSQTEYFRLGQYSFSTMGHRFGSWRAALEQVQLQPGRYFNIPAASLIEDMCRVAAQLGYTRLKLREYLAHGLYSRKVINRNFGGWAPAALAARLTPNRQYTRRFTQGPRTINVALRFQILRQDRFRCRACGRSPATHPEIELEVDHILPWSAGGTTTPDNLQTLCGQCNRGKSDSQ